MAHKNSLLTKRREPKPTNSACAEFANQNAGFIGGKTFQGENRQTVREFGFAEFWSFVPLQRKTQCLRQNLVAKAAKTSLPYILSTLLKVEFSCFLKSSKNEALCRKSKALCLKYQNGSELVNSMVFPVIG